MLLFRHADRRWPFLWESADQAEGRWHRAGEGPAQYLADTPDGAWAEFIRHEEIDDPADLQGVARALWAVDVEVKDPYRPPVPTAVAQGPTSTYPVCQEAAARARGDGHTELDVPSAALRQSGGSGYRVDEGFRPGSRRDPRVFVLFGRRPDAVGWAVVSAGRPPVEVLDHVRPLRTSR